MAKKRGLVIIVLEYGIALSVGGVLFTLWQSNLPPIVLLLVIDVIMTGIIFFFSFIHNNSSIYDPYWSVIPPFLYGLMSQFWYGEGLLYYLIGLSIVLWSIRLTYNWAIRFNGLKEEDFRYIEFRDKFKKWYWPISFLGIHLFPTLLVFLGFLPIMSLVIHDTPVVIYIGIGSIVVLFGFVLSFIADKTLRIHREEMPNTPLDYGVWAYSRHPNYLGELLFWYGLAIMGGSVNILYPLMGVLPMTLLFQFYSIPKMEERILNKKPGYQDVIDSVPKLVSIRYTLQTFFNGEKSPKHSD